MITRAEALEIGADDRAIVELISSGILIRQHPGVYVLAGATSTHLLRARAALAGTDYRAMVSHFSAAWLMGLIDLPQRSVHLTVPLGVRRRLAGVVFHTTRSPVDGMLFRGVRCTTPIETMLAVAAAWPDGDLASMVDRALAGRLVDRRALDIATSPGAWRPGARRLRALLLKDGYSGVPNPSVLESRMWRLFKAYLLPAPKAEVRAGQLGTFRLDYAYPEVKLAVEVHGYAFHSSPKQMSADLARHRKLTLEGWTVLAFSWTQVVHESAHVALEIRDALVSLNSGRPANLA